MYSLNLIHTGLARLYKYYVLVMGDSLPQKTNFYILVSIVIVLIAGGLRLYHIEERSLWLDEAKSANFARGTLSDTLTYTQEHDSGPMAHPLLLYVMQKVGDGPLVVRLPSFVASVLAVVVMLGLVLARVPWRAAVFSALLLGVSASQIVYAQEVRSYALSVLFGALLLWAFLYFSSNVQGRKGLKLLCFLLFLAPSIQYGLVLLGFGILGAMGVLYLMDTFIGIRLRHMIFSGLSLASGGLLALSVTLRHQMRLVSQQVGERSDDYFDAGEMNIIVFVLKNTFDLITYVLPGVYILSLVCMALLIYACKLIRCRHWEPVFVLMLASMSIAILASLSQVYPYAGTRQCLYLAPLLTLAAGKSLDYLVEKLPSFDRQAATIAIIGIIFLSGFSDIKNSNPYQEVEDIKTVLTALDGSRRQEDSVYIYYGAIPAFEFYVREGDPQFIYGKSHREDPTQYAMDIRGSVKPDTQRLWLVFSHVVRNEEQLILSQLQATWTVASVVSAPGAALYVAKRREP